MQTSKSLDKGIIMIARYTVTKSFFYTHTASMVIMDGIVVILMYVCAARLKILENKLTNAVKYEHLTELIREHQDILE